MGTNAAAMRPGPYTVVYDFLANFAHSKAYPLITRGSVVSRFLDELAAEVHHFGLPNFYRLRILHDVCV